MADLGSARVRYAKNAAGVRHFYFSGSPQQAKENPFGGQGALNPPPPLASRWDYAALGFGRGLNTAEQKVDCERLLLREAVAKIHPIAPGRIELRLEPSDPAHRLRPTLRLDSPGSSNLLTAVAAAYGLRWVWIRPEAPRKVAFLGRQDFVGTPAGLRHALSQALPPELYGSLVGTPSECASSAGAPLRGLTPEQLDQLERLTTRGTVPLRQLPHELAKPLGQHLAARSALALGRACDQFFQARPVHRSVSIQYGANPFGTKQFSFGRGNSFIGVVPE